MPNGPIFIAFNHAESAWDDPRPCRNGDADEVVLGDADRHALPSPYDLCIATPNIIFAFGFLSLIG